MSVQSAGTSELSAGSVFAGRYRVERRIAAGGMGAVYEVVHLETNRRRALKVMHAEYVSSDELRSRFRQEAQVAAEIESEHIVDVFDAGVDEATGMPFLVMELLRGQDLGKVLKQVGALPKVDVVRYLYETSLALDKTHRARIVHRDLKPDNLFLCEREFGAPRVKVLDFGIAKIVKDAETQANATKALGTPLYMAPEQFQLEGGVSAATDIFALGMIAFTLLVGKPYWFLESKIAKEMIAFALHVAQGPKESAVGRAWTAFGVDLPKAFDAWFFRATAPEPGARFASAGEAVRTLAEALSVPLPGPAFGITNSSVPALTPVEQDADEAATIALPLAGQSSPRTGPTLMAMTPGGASPGGARDRKRTFVLIGLATSAVVGLAGMFAIGRTSGEVDARSGATATALMASGSSSSAVVVESLGLPAASASAVEVLPAASTSRQPVVATTTAPTKETKAGTAKAKVLVGPQVLTKPPGPPAVKPTSKKQTGDRWKGD